MITELNLVKIAQNAKKASYKLASLTEEVRNNALLIIAEEIENNKNLILEENNKDLIEAKKLIEQGKLTQSLYDRLKLDEEKIKVMVQGIRDVAKLKDPVNKVSWAIELDKELELYRASCPIGVIGVIFESRPDVVPQIAALTIKSSNAVILKGGSEAGNSNEILVNIINNALNKVTEYPENSINLIKTRDDVQEMLKLDEYIDLIIPRGSNKLVKYIQSNTKIPVLGHAEGICHIYIDEFADLDKATKISIDSKIQYPSACNAVETILIHKKLSNKYLPELIQDFKDVNVQVKGDIKTRQVVENIEETTEEDWKTEYSDKIVSFKIVENIIEAIDHINTYGSGHTDSIITEDRKNAELFMNLVDSSGVYHNASTRFADGFRYGFGAEVGISTNKTHARGPVGIEGLVIYKYKLYGNGHIVSEYSGKNSKGYTHKRIK
ncbi:MAG: glutamate-5-semialdehyde dehydrogenase [Candidatus Melainabacteria bacterium RIFOXYA2_FULL_32_9]|nr:MAG: glutamate-5-semialdehyde dehydrogenase [Candidatus Melainabacteria bacterium RIFOXYA2_FULL_32_9]